MRELTKSMFSYTWAMSVFGLQQVVNLLTPGNGDSGGKAANAFDNVTDATVKTFGGAVKEAYKAGDSLQKGVIDIMFGGCAAGGLDPNGWLRTGTDTLRKVTDLGRNAAQTASQAAGFTAASAAGAPPASAGGTGPRGGGDWGPMPR